MVLLFRIEVGLDITIQCGLWTGMAVSRPERCVMNVTCATSMRAVMQADAPTATGYGINWYGGPVLNNKAGIVVSLPSRPRC